MIYYKNGFTFKFYRMRGTKAVWQVLLGEMHFAYVNTAAVKRALNS